MRLHSVIKHRKHSGYVQMYTWNCIPNWPYLFLKHYAYPRRLDKGAFKCHIESGLTPKVIVASIDTLLVLNFILNIPYSAFHAFMQSCSFTITLTKILLSFQIVMHNAKQLQYSHGRILSEFSSHVFLIFFVNCQMPMGNYNAKKSLVVQSSVVMTKIRPTGNMCFMER